MPEVTQPSTAQATPETAAGSSQVAPPPAQAAKEAGAGAKAPEAAKPAAETQGTVLTDSTAAPTGAEAKAGEKPQAEATPAKEEKPVVPEKYDLKLPKDSTLGDAHIEKLSTYAKEKGLSNEQAQSLLERESQAVSDYVSNLKETQSTMLKDWVTQAQGDKEIGGEAFKQNAELAKRVVTRFGTDEFKKELNKSGLGNHPELLRVFTRIGKAMSEDQLIIPGAQAAGKRSIESLLYGEGENKET